MSVPSLKKLPHRTAFILLGITAVLLSLHLSMQYLNLSQGEKNGQIFEISNRLDFDDEVSIPTWFSQAVWLGVAAASALAVWFSKKARTRQVWYGLAALGTLFSLDEVAGIHELSLQTLHLLFFGIEQPTSSLNAWWIVLPLVLVVLAIFVKRLYHVLHLKQWFLVLCGWGFLLVGAIGFDLIGIEVKRGTFLYHGVIVGAEETLELLGGILILYVILNYLVTIHGSELEEMRAIKNKR